MTTRLLGLALGTAVLGACLVQADDKNKDDDAVAKAMSKIAQAGPGVHAIKTDKQGRITSCVVVGQARISTVLGKAKGLETARQRARLGASAEFVKWLKEGKVSVHVKADDETIILLEGTEGVDKDTLKESGKAVEKTSKKMESISEGLVRGLQVLHVEVSDKDKTYTLVMGWDAKTSEATKKVGQDLKTDDPKKAPAKEKDAKKPEDPKKNPDKKIEDKKVTSPDAKKFLP